jgi:hypothetical protein
MEIPKRLWITVVVLGAGARLLPRPWNFTPRVLLGRLTCTRSGLGAIAATALASSLSFFLVTNFMFWATSRFYLHTVAGLSACYAAGLPLYRHQLLGDAFYMVAIFGGYAAISHFYQLRRQAA